MIDSYTRLVAILGHPVRHSLSPLIHNTSFTRQHLNIRYVALDVSPQNLATTTKGLLAMGFLGANVTIPHKEAVMPFMDSLSVAARAAGAVNTIVCSDGTLHGDNTDIAGFLAPLTGHDLNGASVVIFGAGGAARAAAYGLLKDYKPGALVVAARRAAQAEELVANLSTYDDDGVLRAVEINLAGAWVRSARMIVNTTPVGMHPHTEATPWPDASDLSEGQLVYDLVYRPQQTQLMQAATQAGAKVIGGLEMFVQQAAAAYKQWTARSMDTDAVRKALAGALAEG